MKMKRLMVQPTQFGSVEGQYGWEGTEDTTLHSHMDYCSMYRHQYSVRIWEPGREALSQPGIDGNDPNDERGTELPMRTTVHGVKGSMSFAFGTDNLDLGTWTNDAGDPMVVPAPLAWLALTGDFDAGYLSELPADQNLLQGLAMTAMMRRAGMVRIPVFFCLYRGTLKFLDEQAGPEIDSGPGDDPATLLSMDITNPSTLESSRIDWWDHEMWSLPRRKVSWNRTGSSAEADFWQGWMTANGHLEQTLSNDSSGGFHEYRMNLETNKVLGPDQVLWLHVMTGAISLPVIHLVTAQNGSVTPVLSCGRYTGHRFSIGVHASMLVSNRLQL